MCDKHKDFKSSCKKCMDEVNWMLSKAIVASKRGEIDIKTALKMTNQQKIDWYNQNVI